MMAKEEKKGERGEGTNLQCLLIVLDVVAVNIVVGANRFPKLGSNNHSRALGCRAAGEEHNPAASILERRLEKPDSNAEGNSGTAEVSSVASNGPRVLLQLLEDLSKLEFALLNRQ